MSVLPWGDADCMRLSRCACLETPLRRCLRPCTALGTAKLASGSTSQVLVQWQKPQALFNQHFSDNENIN